MTRSPGHREENLIGREQELALLDLAFAQPHTAIVSLVAAMLADLFRAV